MKNRLAYLFLGIFGLVGLASCESQLEDVPSVKTRTVFFSSVEKDAATRTGITIENKVVTPDWRKTKAANVHLFETGNDGGVSTGEDVEITVASDNLTASFKADFPAEWTIIVDPTEPTEEETKGGGTKAASNAPYTYSAVVAQKSGESFIVPSVQYPDAETLIDPDADFLIGYSKKSYGDPHDYTENVVDLYFDRPVALSRITVTNFEEGEKVKSVTIKAQSGLTGSAAYNAIDFENAKVTFTPGTESGTIELSYGNGIDIEADGTFEAYFVSLPGAITITELAVATDKYNYVKTIEGGKEFTFTTTSLKPIKFDLTTATKEEATPDNTVWYKASVLEDGIDYLIVSGGQALKNNDGSTTGVSVTDNEGVITLEAADPTIVWTAAAHTEMTGSGSSDVVAGHFTITNEGYYLQRNSEEILLATTIPSDKPKYVVWDYDGSYLKHESSGTMTFYCYYDGGWATGYTQNGAAPSSSIKTVQIYTSRTPQEIAFTPAASAEYDLATSEWTVAVPTLSGVQTSVTYALSEDSNPAVATVDADGTVHPISRGTVTIVATAAGNDQYQAASASYTLRVVDNSVTTNTYYKVTSTSNLETGAQYLIVYEGESKVFKPILESSSSTTFTKSTDNALNAEISGGTITSNEFDNCHLTLESGYYLKADAAGKYLYPDVASSRGVLSAESSASHSLNITIGSNGIASIITKSGTYYLVWSTSSDYFSANTDIEGSYSTGICLYKLDDGRQPQTLSFSPTASAEYDLGTSTWTVAVPTLNGVQTSVSYALSDDSNPAVATVDADGTVHPKSRGTATIIATAAANAQYRAGSASYTLTITDSSVSIPTWYKADEIEDGETYLIVSNGYLLQNNGGSVAAVAVEVNNDIIVFDAPSTDIWTATASSGKFTFKNDGKYLYRSSTTLSINSNSVAWSYDSSTNYLSNAGSSSTYYLFYDTSQNSFRVSSSSPTSSRTTTLYTSTPPRQSQTLAFSATSVNFDIAGSATFTAPTLSGAKTTVTYSSSKPAVATVDAVTGAVEIVGTGTTIITASAEETDTYKPATATYTIHVTDSSAPVTTKRYVLASSIEDGRNYIIVSGGYALKNDGGSVASVAVTPADGAIEFEQDEDEDVVWTASYVDNIGSGTSGTIAGEYAFSNGSYRFSCEHGQTGGTLKLVSVDTTVDKYAVWYLMTYEGNTYLYHVSRSTGYFTYYSNGWKMTLVNSSTTPSSTEQPTQLYVEDGN